MKIINRLSFNNVTFKETLSQQGRINVSKTLLGDTSINNSFIIVRRPKCRCYRLLLLAKNFGRFVGTMFSLQDTDGTRAPGGGGGHSLTWAIRGRAAR